MRVADLFSGCGGMSLGLRGAGMEPVFAADHWLEAGEVYEKLMGHAPLQLDLHDVVEATRKVRRHKVDVIAGGPPCQDFSSAGDRVERSRADLTRCFAETVSAVRPQWFIMENVLLARSSDAYAKAKRVFRSAGYGLTETVMNAAHYGVPQIRKRLIVVGRLEEEDGFLSPWIDDGRSELPMTVRDYVGDEFGIEYYYRHPRVWEKRAIYSIDEPAATIRTVNRPIPGNYRVHPNDATHPTGVRQLTPKERARIQTFPARFKYDCSMTMADEMVGNAVPVKLAEFVGRQVLRYEKMRSKERDLEEFRGWLVDVSGLQERSAGNVISRLRRARGMLGMKRFVDPRDAAHELGKSEEFAQLTVTVRSQLRRALGLYAEFAGKR